MRLIRDTQRREQRYWYTEIFLCSSFYFYFPASITKRGQNKKGNLHKRCCCFSPAQYLGKSRNYRYYNVSLDSVSMHCAQMMYMWRRKKSTRPRGGISSKAAVFCRWRKWKKGKKGINVMSDVVHSHLTNPCGTLEPVCCLIQYKICSWEWVFASTLEIPEVWALIKPEDREKAWREEADMFPSVVSSPVSQQLRISYSNRMKE